MLVGYGVRDHCLFAVYFSTASMIGTCPPKIICPASHRLNTKIPECVLWYNWMLCKNILRHQLLESMICVEESDGSKKAILAKLNQLDREGEQYMKHAGKKCSGLNWDSSSLSPQRHHYGSANAKCTALYSGGMPERLGTRAI